MHSLIELISTEFQLPLQNPVLIFSLILFIILLVPMIFQRLGIPGIVGLIVSGIVIGPYGLNILEQSLFVEVFSTIGLLYIMFIAGLELNLNEFKEHRNKSLLFGLFTFAMPAAIGLPVCYYILGFDFYASLLVASIFATHTLVAYPIVSKLGASKDLSVAITVGGTILTDTAVLILLAIILGASNGGLTAQFWIRLLISIAIFSAFMFLVVPRVAEWVLQKLEKEAYTRYIFVLAIVFMAGFLAKIASLEPIIGAFFAGLVLNRLIPQSSALMNRINFLGNALFIPFFLISVGMIVNIHVVLSGPETLIIAVALLAVAMVGKYLAAITTRIAFKMSSDQGHLIFGLSSAHAAATLAVVLVGFRAGIVSDSVLNAIVIIILVSCLIASFVSERAAKRIASSSDEYEDPTLISALDMEQILIPLSANTQVEQLLDFAVLLKDPSSTHPLALLNVVENTDEAEKQVAMAKKTMAGFLAETTASDTEVNVMATIDHNRAHGISRTAREIAADLILIGWPQRQGLFNGLTSNRIGSILEHTVKTLFVCHLPNPVVRHKALFLVVPPYAELEEGFPIWLNKILKLATELSIPINLNSTERTCKAIERFCDLNKLTVPVNFRKFTDWSDILILFREMSDSDLIIMVSARNGYISHNTHADGLPAKLEKYFPNFNRIVILPQ